MNFNGGFEDPLNIHNREQKEAAMLELGQLYFAFFNGMKGSGFNAQEALELTKSYIAAIVSQARSAQ